MRSVAPEARLERSEGLVGRVGTLGVAEAGPARWPARRRRQRARGRALATESLSALTHLPQRRFAIRSGPRNAPEVYLDGVPAPGLHVSIAHSGDLAMAVAARFPVGVDVEDWLTGTELDGLAFSEEERHELRSLPPDERAARRAELWCQLEAVSKWRGVGLTVPFCDLRPTPGVAVRFGHWTTRRQAWAVVYGAP